jgi:hypothetical protein
MCLLISAKVLTHCFQRKRQELVQNLKYTFEGLRIKKRADMHILGGLLFMWDGVPMFQNAVSVVTPQNTQFWYSKNRKYTFRGKK